MLRQWGLQAPALYLLCGEKKEIFSHLFYNCNYSRKVLMTGLDATEQTPWKQANTPTPRRGDLLMTEDLMETLQKFSEGSNCWKLHWTLLGALSWYIWQERQNAKAGYIKARKGSGIRGNQRCSTLLWCQRYATWQRIEWSQSNGRLEEPCSAAALCRAAMLCFYLFQPRGFGCSFLL